MRRRLNDGEKIFVRDHSQVFDAVVQRTSLDVIGHPVVPRIDRRWSPEQLQMRDNCYGMDELERLAGDLEEEADMAMREAKRIRDLLTEKEMADANQ